MVALCPQHHDQADGGLWTTTHLRAFKHSPFVDEAIKVQWPWQPETLVLKVGPSLVVGSGSPIRLNGRPVMHFRPSKIETLGVQTVQFDSEIRSEDEQPWMRIEESWFDLILAGTTDLVFTPQTRSFKATHRDTSYLSMKFTKKPLEQFLEWIPTFIFDPDTAASVGNTVAKLGAIDSEGQVSVVIFEGQFRSKEVEVKITGDRMKFRCFVRGLEEEFDMTTKIVDSEHRALLRMHDGPEFFSLG
jgi:hypothetical protein